MPLPLIPTVSRARRASLVVAGVLLAAPVPVAVALVAPSPAGAATAAPTVGDAMLLPAAKNAHSYRVRVIASDPGPGITAVETSATTSGGTTIKVSATGEPSFDAVVSPTGPSIPRYARVENAAGAWSPWVPVTPQLSVAPRLHGGLLTAAPNGASFVMRGFDYQPVTKVPGTTNSFVNDTFTPSSYSAAAVSSALGQMAKLGYNGVRVFVNVGLIGNTNGAGLDAAYVSKMANFITTAAADRIRVLLCTGELPSGGGYTPAPSATLAGTNAYQLEAADIAGKERYLKDLVTMLRADDAPLSDVLWELAGEQDWNNKEAPLSLKHGLVKTAAGTYNMASAASRAAMENNNLAHWVNVLSAELHALVPASLVGVGIYSPSINLKRPGWTVAPAALFAKSSLDDFVDIHVYSNLGSQIAQMQSYGASGSEKALIMGEFGAARSAFSTPAAGARGEVAWQQESCRLGLNLSGWLLWTWNSSAQTEYWTALEGGGAIEKAMAPAARPNPCR